MSNLGWKVRKTFWLFFACSVVHSHSLYTSNSNLKISFSKMKHSANQPLLNVKLSQKIVQNCDCPSKKKFICAQCFVLESRRNWLYWPKSKLWLGIWNLEEDYLGALCTLHRTYSSIWNFWLCFACLPIFTLFSSSLSYLLLVYIISFPACYITLIVFQNNKNHTFNL